jgi:hypothetical protein
MYAIHTGGRVRFIGSQDELLDGETSSESVPEIVIDPKDAIRAQIVMLEQSQLMPRATREFMLMFMEANAPAEVLAVNPGYQSVKAFDNDIKVLRAQL